MSKYRARGAYHYEEFEQDTPYRRHVLDLVEQVVAHTNKQLLMPKVIEIGAGEGLILSKIADQGFQCEGCDVDVTAVGLAKIYKNKVQLGDVTVFAQHSDIDVVLLCDVLEHVENPIREMAEARRLAPNGIVVIAIPDREDRHARHEVKPDQVSSYMEPNGWECIHKSQRHARHLMIWRRKVA